MLQRRQMTLESIHKHNASSSVRLAYLSTRSDSNITSHSLLDCVLNTIAHMEIEEYRQPRSFRENTVSITLLRFSEVNLMCHIAYQQTFK